MDVKKILAEIDGEVARLQQIRAALIGVGGVSTGKRRGRPKGSTNAAKPAKRKKRNLSPEGRKRIAEAMKRRWAERRKELAKK
jgi:transposase